MDFLSSYVFLLEERFGNNLSTSIDIPSYIKNLHIVPLSLQILFENAIKHNIISKKKPLKIEVFVKNGEQLIIRNNLQRKRQTMPSTKLGLQNIKNRYAYFSKAKVEITEDEAFFTVKLPLIQVSKKVATAIEEA